MTLTYPIPVLKRRARQLARELGIPLHAALDHVAHREGFRTWSHLSASATAPRAARALLAQLEPGDLTLLAARPGQGKTVLGLELAIEALERGGDAWFFSLACTEDEVQRWIADAALDAAARHRLQLDTSDDITADHIIDKLDGAGRGTLVVVDYLQLLDRRRRDPELGAQLSSLRAFTRARGLVTVCLSQIDRAFERSARPVPTFTDVHLPNPLDLTLFTKGCFLHKGRLEIAHQR